MEQTPIKKQKVYELILERIQNSVKEGQISPGDRLPSEREMANYFSVSRGAVREAISVLEVKGLIVVKQGLGNFLVPNPQEEILQQFDAIFNEKQVFLIELLELRQSIEGQAAYLAALRRTEADLKKIRVAFDELETSINQNQIAAEEDFHFHYAVIEASHNSMMAHTVRLISDALIKGLHDAREDALRIPGKPKLVLAEHEEIWRAIENRDPELASKSMIKHLENVKEQISRVRTS